MHYFHGRWRKFRDGRRTATSSGFIDGDLISRFLELEQTRQNRVIKDMPGQVSLEAILDLIEQLSRVY